ncbi:PucR family transcriptional regulator ligand-binding domain-containing protein [Tsukamurella sp. 8F]|uniref:PucR family transcriptional regulator n=1 Tax=unclassified Tsukamurella TaxID=2633480 RepID=UPI0023B92BDE|nr:MULTISPECIES: PucR family transcriptional regulator [unclassified Tsukamurella]MDF0529861.1 PucR family transcriptional regulator ligand-binding domain-containing protein [Tsukamurella sp. 8J]MDF0587053.1 PucR family transcriptional regulator ligand-binding domain-containing protein [Tsukamurella sp. 8F]
MEVTVARVLALPEVRAGRPELLTDAPLDSPVRWVHVGDAPDVKDLLTGGELILTTGRSLSEDPVGYVDGLVVAGAVGLLVELGPRLAAVPDGAVASARRAGMPLAALHRRIRFVEVTEQVHREIVAGQYAEVEFARHTHEVFTALSMRRAGADDIVGAAANLLGTPVVLEDTARRVVAVAALGHAPAELLRGWERRASDPDVGTGVGTDVGVDRRVFARLVAPLADEERRGRTETVLERAAQALALREMVERDRSLLEQQAQSGLLDDLRNGRVPDEPSASARARALGVPTALRYRPLAVVSDITPGAHEVDAQRRQVQMHDAVRYALSAAGLSALTAAGSGRIDLILSCPKGFDESAAEAIGRRIAAETGRVRGVRRTVLGAGPAAGRLIDAAGGLAEAAHVAQVALSMPHSGRQAVFGAGDTRLRGLAALLRDDPRVSAFAEAELRGLLASPRAAELTDLLRAYLEEGGHKTALAARLHLSRPTLYARLADLQAVLGTDLDDPESRTSLHAALLFRDSRATR